MDKRRHTRHDRCLEARYSTQNNTSQQNYTVTKNISKSGISMPVYDGLHKGDNIHIDIALNHGQPFLSAVGKVVWLKPVGRIAPMKYEVGIEFESIDQNMIDGLLVFNRSS